jgi:hypothetical protein
MGEVVGQSIVTAKRNREDGHDGEPPPADDPPA